MRTVSKILIGLSVMTTALCSQAKVTMSPLFTDNMVLQQQATVPVWGSAGAGKKVKVTTSWDKRSYTTVADASGDWSLTVNTPVAGGPYDITVTDGDKVRLSNVMIGEVWLCSGQSNMEMPMDGNWARVYDSEAEVAAADCPNLRLLYVQHETDVHPSKNVIAVDNGWQECNPASAKNFSAVAYYFGRELVRDLDVPVGLILSAWGGTCIEAWISAEALKQVPEHRATVERVAATPSIDDMKFANGWERCNMFTGLYNAMISPLMPYTIKGALWYQGESNVYHADRYSRLFPMMINNWREGWGYDFPFYFVQLAAFDAKGDRHEYSPWAEIREAQTRTLAVPGTGMAVTIDRGDANDIHPRDKRSVGERLALIAKAKTYGKPVDYSGPMYRSHEIDGNRMVIEFDYAGGLTTSDGAAPKGFRIAGVDGRMRLADARIEGDRIVVSSPDVKYPVEVRYAWAENPECNIVNGAGLPASPFRSSGGMADERRPVDVLCLGNSITRHEYKADIEWFSEWGMAASKEENDYCHRLETMLGAVKPGSTVTPRNIAYWERNLTSGLDSLIGEECRNKDVIVIRLGENVQDREAFVAGIDRLIKYCKGKAPKVVVTGCFWKDEAKERAIIDAARANGVPFVAIDWIDSMYDSRPKVGDTLYDIEGKPYTVTKEFIISHPDDKGMEKIAEAIYGLLI